MKNKLLIETDILVRGQDNHTYWTADEPFICVEWVRQFFNLKSAPEKIKLLLFSGPQEGAFPLKLRKRTKGEKVFSYRTNSICCNDAYPDVYVLMADTLLSRRVVLTCKNKVYYLKLLASYRV